MTKPTTQHAIIDRLLYEEEGATLDFKSEQYKFSGATDDEKSELLKDVIAFSNAWRRADAYILVGAKEVKGGRSVVVGISEDLDDAHLQQFINSKLNRPIEFSYRTIEFEGARLGLIQIANQKRPFYLKKDFGRLKSNTVYIRRGSSTDTAAIDEIALMGAELATEVARKPLLEAFLVHGQHDEFQERHVAAQTINVSFPNDNAIPDYGSKYHSLGGNITIPSLDQNVNYDFFRDKAKYLTVLPKVKGFKIGVRNSGSLSGRDVKVVMEIQGGSEDIIFAERCELPSTPKTDRLSFLGANLMKKNSLPDVTVQKTLMGWRATCTIGKIQPQEVITTFDRIFVGAESSQQLKIDVRVYCDDLSEPVSSLFEIDFDVIPRAISVDELVRMKT